MTKLLVTIIFTYLYKWKSYPNNQLLDGDTNVPNQEEPVPPLLTADNHPSTYI